MNTAATLAELLQKRARLTDLPSTVAEGLLLALATVAESSATTARRVARARRGEAKPVSDNLAQAVEAGLGEITIAGWELGPVVEITCRRCGHIIALGWSVNLESDQFRFVPAPTVTADSLEWICPRCKGSRSIDSTVANKQIRAAHRGRVQSLTTANRQPKPALRLTTR